MTYCGSKYNFFKKNSEACLITAKVQIQPGSSEIGRSLRKIQNIPPKVSQQNESGYMYPRWSIIYVGCSSQLSISRFGSRFTKKPNFGTLKIEKVLFMGENKNRSPWDSLPSQWPRACPIWSHSDKLCHDREQT
jgi:hypothetical protein